MHVHGFLKSKECGLRKRVQIIIGKFTKAMVIHCVYETTLPLSLLAMGNTSESVFLFLAPLAMFSIISTVCSPAQHHLRVGVVVGVALLPHLDTHL